MKLCIFKILCIFLACKPGCHVCAVPVEAKRDVRLPGSEGTDGVSPTQVLGGEPMSSGRASTLNCGAMPATVLPTVLFPLHGVGLSWPLVPPSRQSRREGQGGKSMPLTHLQPVFLRLCLSIFWDPQCQHPSEEAPSKLCEPYHRPLVKLGPSHHPAFSTFAAPPPPPPPVPLPSTAQPR